MKEQQKATIAKAMYNAFVYGWGFGEAVMEESMENNDFDSFDNEGKYVHYKLRSDQWRKEHLDNSKKFKEELENLLSIL